MKKNQHALKVFVVLILSTAYVFGFSQYGPKVLGALFAAEKGYLPGTAVGTINLEGRTPKEALSLLQEAIADWQANSSFTLHFKEKSIDLGIDRFAFDPEGTITSLVDGKQNAVQVNVADRTLIEWIEKISPALIGEEIDLKKMGEKLSEPAKLLSSESVSFALDPFLANGQKDEGVIASGTIDVSEPSYELEMAVKELSEIKVAGHAEFSINRALEEKGLSGISPMAASMLATSVYIAVLQTNFDILERNISKELPDYAKLGSEAFANPVAGKDFIFKNPNAGDYSLEFTYSGGKLAATIEGSEFLYDYKAVADGEETFQPKTIKQYSPYVRAGQVKITEEGKPGSIIKIYREIYSQGNLLDTQFIGEDFYAPVHRVEVHALPAGEPQQQGGAAGPSPSGSAETPAPATNPVDGNGQPARVPVPVDGNSQPGPVAPGLSGNGQAPVQNDHLPDSDGDGALWGKPNEVPK
ncbi:G5 domain-containing protein [Bacillus sp. FJAT-27245]|uniref:G5 domain-containing protein n=1 Tax=Bacillus sp. FJAT-27245 TaxID=1684144 RepID=UPI0006A7BF5B|nr:G5 domain-containing protein [Bacillus sp. FJAT-27245]